MRFTAILLEKFPVKTIESQVAEKVCRNCFQEFTERRALTAELKPYKPLNGFALVGNDLCLPY